LSYPEWFNGRMNMTWIAQWGKSQGQVIARFGNAALIKQHDGRFELLGGSEDDRTEAKEWISLFMNEAAPLFRNRQAT
jgi:hypothetical protein